MYGLAWTSGFGVYFSANEVFKNFTTNIVVEQKFLVTIPLSLMDLLTMFVYILKFANTFVAKTSYYMWN